MSDPGWLRLLVAGDLHQDFGDLDRAAYAGARPDGLLFIGDLGEEDPEIAAAVAAAYQPVFAILGNHDAGSSLARGQPTRRLSQILDVLKDADLAYRALALSDRWALVGARPFSSGGGAGRMPPLIAALYGYETAEDSARAIVQAAEEVRGRRIILCAHAGPKGLGAERDAPFGRDFRRPSSDFGDEDLALALGQLREAGHEVPLLFAGHMHETLVGGGRRRRCGWLQDTLVINAAVVPRHRHIHGQLATHHLEVALSDDGPFEVADRWSDARGAILRRERLHRAIPSRSGR